MNRDRMICLEPADAFIAQIEWIIINNDMITNIVRWVCSILYVFDANLYVLLSSDLHGLRENILIFGKRIDLSAFLLYFIDSRKQTSKIVRRSSWD